MDSKVHNGMCRKRCPAIAAFFRGMRPAQGRRRCRFSPVKTCFPLLPAEVAFAVPAPRQSHRSLSSRGLFCSAPLLFSLSDCGFPSSPPSLNFLSSLHSIAGNCSDELYLASRLALGVSVWPPPALRGCGRLGGAKLAPASFRTTARGSRPRHISASFMRLVHVGPGSYRTRALLMDAIVGPAFLCARSCNARRGQLWLAGPATHAARVLTVAFCHCVEHID